MPTTEYSSAGKTFSMSRWAIMFDIVARRSPAITTPPGNVAATMVVACGVRSPRLPETAEREVGRTAGATAAASSTNDEVPARRNAVGRPPREVVREVVRDELSLT